jgi:hypothetical protein
MNPSPSEKPMPTSTSEPTQPQITTNPDGSMYMRIEGSASLSFNINFRGNLLNHRKLFYFAIAKQLEKFSSDLAKQLRENYVGFVLALLAFLTLPALLLQRQKPLIRF